MTEVGFDPRETVVVLPCLARHGERILQLRMALDTGASTVLIGGRKLELLGLDLGEAVARAEFGDASTTNLSAPVVTLTSFGVARAELGNVECIAYTLPEEYGLDGVIGLNYLRRYRQVTLDFERSVIQFQRRDEPT